MDERPKCSVVLAISDPGANVAARHVVHQHPRFEIMREVPNAVMAIEACRYLKPDLALISDDSPGLRGSEVVSEVRAESPDTLVVLLATYDASYLQRNEHAFLAASLAVPEDLRHALDTVADYKDDPDGTDAPERRRTDRRQKQDWNKVFAERRGSDRRD